MTASRNAPRNRCATVRGTKLTGGLGEGHCGSPEGAGNRAQAAARLGGRVREDPCADRRTTTALRETGVDTVSTLLLMLLEVDDLLARGRTAAREAADAAIKAQEDLKSASKEAQKALDAAKASVRACACSCCCCC